YNNNQLSQHITSHVSPNKTGMYVVAKGLSLKVDTNPKPIWKSLVSNTKVVQPQHDPATKTLLNDLNFSLQPGRMVLLMGPPSSGKSILLQLLANRHPKQHSTIDGQLLFNGHVADDKTHHRDTIFVPQDDRHIPILTVQQTMDFSANCNMGQQSREQAKKERVDLILEMVGLTEQRNTLVGDELIRGISGGQKRRVTLASEFTKCPNLILMDEPTTGLDSATSFNICNHVKTIAIESKSSAVLSLLQPSPELFTLFDDVILLGEHGTLCYFGPREQLLPSTLLDDIKLCLSRQFTVMKMVRKQYIVRFVQAIVMGFVLGSLFFQLGDTQTGGRNRFAILYFAMNLHIWTSYPSIEEFHQLRPVFYLQQDGKYYRAFAYFLSLVVSKFPVSFIESTLFATICYWTAGFNASADRFFVFIICNALTNIVAQGLFQCASAYSSTQLKASLVTPAIILLFMISSGFILPRTNYPDWWIWLYYLDPLKYVLDALASNEMVDKTFHCAPHERIPPPTLQLFGFNDTLSWRWIDLFIVVCYAFVLFTLFFIGLKWLRFETKKPPRTISYGIKVKKDRKNTIIDANNVAMANNGGCYMTIENLNYSVQVKKRNEHTGKTEKAKLQLLNNINAFVKPGMMALMGPSGAGKSTLLDILAKRKNGGEITGQVSINGQSIDSMQLTRFTAYVEQQDILPENLTVKEAVYMSALCRLPDTMPNEDKMKLVEEIIKLLHLTKVQDSKIGLNPMVGISLANRKKVSIAIEMAADPQLLFLDEPTSGLDSTAALKVMNCIRKVVKSGRTVICTIHQPSQEIFEEFDQLLLLAKGEVIYFGDTGPNCQTVVDYFAHQGYHMQHGRNAADFILEVAELRDEARNPIQYYRASTECQTTTEQLTNKQVVPTGVTVPKFTNMYGSSLRTQMYCLTKRAWLNHVRRPTTILIRFLRGIIPAFILGTMFLRLDHDQSGARNRLAMIFQSFVFAGISSVSKIPMALEDRSLFYREKQSGTYPPFIYLAATLVTDLPMVVMTSLVYWIPFFLLSGMDGGEGGGKFFFSLLIYFLMTLCYDNLALMFAFVMPELPVAALISSMALNFLGLFGGFFIPGPDIPRGWKWLHWLMFSRYGLESIGVTELRGATFDCPNDVGAYPIPVGKNTMMFCPITSGDTLLERYGLEYDRVNWNIFMLIAFNIAYIMLSFLALTFIRHQRK
ncbi:hypothetical protein SAMD00019534_066560, partial [Acytostelium subglobosum LB1]|uniref:hypothetical protein n=1 Tax=Acytostelium subglobosum LB1 TaxID=1410327 RepID=UPI000644E8E5